MIKTYDGSSFKRVGGEQGDRSPVMGYTRLRVTYAATGGETSINLAALNSQFSYTPGRAQISVKRSSGGAMIAGTDYFETTSTTIGFPTTDPLLANEIVEITREAQITGIAAVQPRPDSYEVTGTAGQTVITANFSWPYAAQPCAVRLYINGIRQRRTVDFTEVNMSTASTNQITLVDALVGGENILLEPWYVPVDASAASTTFNGQQITAVQSLVTAGAQNFVDESAQISVPNTTIINRAKIADIVNDLRPSFGVERIVASACYEIPNEFGPNGERVFGLLGDTRGLIRFVGFGWRSAINSSGQWVYGDVNNDYMEITFYGTGLNLLGNWSSSNKNIAVAVDGGAYGGNILPATFSSVLDSRNYNINTVLPAASGLSLGLHTVKVKINAASTDFPLSAIEIINSAATSANVNPGTAYVSGKLVQPLAAASVAPSATFESGTLGSRGGRVLMYLKQDGTIAKAVTPANAASATLTSADHSNEELVRTYHFREFGANRSDDFSTNFSASNRSFTLDDGTTTLIGNSVTSQISSGNETISLDQNGSFVTITFVGTGLDITQVDSAAGGSDSYNISIDGGATVALPTAGNTSVRVVKLVSGLPFGTHTVKITRVTAATWGLRIINFKVFHPKKPALPSNCMEIADYNIMATFVANTTAGAEFISTGVLRKAAARELAYVGTWTNAIAVGTGTTGSVAGFRTLGGSVGSQVRYTFFGTGFDIRMSTPVAVNTYTVAINGQTPTAAGGTTSSYGAWTSFVGSTGVATSNGVGQFANGLVVTGLPLGHHTVTITAASGTQYGVESIDIITPIHASKSALTALQNALPVGSMSLSDIRSTSMVKEAMPSSKAWAQAVGVSISPTTTSTVPVPCPDLSVVIKTGADGKPSTIKISYTVDFFGSVVNQNPGYYMYVNGVQVGTVRDWTLLAAGSAYEASDTYRMSVAPGTHKVDVYWATNAGTLTANSNRRTLLVEEV